MEEEIDDVVDVTPYFEEEIQIVSDMLVSSNRPLPVKHAFVWDHTDLYMHTFYFDIRTDIDEAYGFSLDVSDENIVYEEDTAEIETMGTFLSDVALRAEHVRTELWEYVIGEIDHEESTEQ